MTLNVVNSSRQHNPSTMMFRRFSPTLALILLSTAWGLETPKKPSLKFAPKVVKLKEVDAQIRFSVLDIKPVNLPVRRPKLTPIAETKKIVDFGKTVSTSDGSPVAFSLPVTSVKSVAKAFVKPKSVASFRKPGGAKFKPVPGNSTVYAGGSQFKQIPETNALDGLRKIGASATPVSGPDPSHSAKIVEPATTPPAPFSLQATASSPIAKSSLKRKAPKTAGGAKFKPIPGNNAIEE